MYADPRTAASYLPVVRSLSSCAGRGEEPSFRRGPDPALRIAETVITGNSLTASASDQ